MSNPPRRIMFIVISSHPTSESERYRSTVAASGFAGSVRRGREEMKVLLHARLLTLELRNSSLNPKTRETLDNLSVWVVKHKLVSR